MITFKGTLKSKCKIARRINVTVVSTMAACLLASCSDNDFDGDGITNKSLTYDAVTILNGSQIDGSVTNYCDFFTNPVTTRAVSDVSMPAQATWDNVEGEEVDGTKNSWEYQYGKTYILNNANLNVNAPVNGNTFIVKKGTFTLSEVWGTANAKIVVYKGAKLVVKLKDGNKNLPAIYNYGDMQLAKADYYIAGSLMTVGNVNVGDHALSTAHDNSIHCYVGGDVITSGLSVACDMKVEGKVSNIEAIGQGCTLSVGKDYESSVQPNINSNAKLEINGNATFHSVVVFNNSSNVNITGSLTADSISFNSDATAKVGCKVVTTKGGLNIDNGSSLYVDGGVYVKNVTITGNSHLNIAPKTYSDLGNVYVTGKAGYITIGDEDNKDYGVVKTNVIRVDNVDDLGYSFHGYMALNYDKVMQSDLKQDFSATADGYFQPQIQDKLNNNGDVYIAKTECTDGHGVKPSAPEHEPVVPVIVPVTDISYPEHEHDISATCIALNGNMAYVSYHQRGSKFSGCLEAIKFDDGKGKLMSYLRSNTARDFNHLIVAPWGNGNRIYTTGGEKKGAFMAYFDLNSDGTFGNEASTDNADSLRAVRLEGEDGNCVIRSNDGNHFITASTAGFETFNANNLERENFVSTEKDKAGCAAKHIYISNDNIAALYYTEHPKDTVSTKAEISVFSASDVNLANAAYKIGNLTVGPTNGKNVVKLDGDNLYFCDGRYGFKRYTNGALNGEFNAYSAASTTDDSKRAACNGMDFDDKYLYLAYGGKGIYVLDKTSLKKVAHVACPYSANFVAVKKENGKRLMFVAYGRSKMQIFKLDE